MTETEKAYLAGLIDGEGSVIICKGYRSHYVRSGVRRALSKTTLAHYVCVKIGMNSKETIEYFASKAGAKFDKQEGGWTARLYSKQAIAFLREIFPYLITKKKRASFVMWFQENLMTRGGYRLSDELIKMRELSYEISKQLNNEESLLFHGKPDEFGEQLNLLGKELVGMLTPSQASGGKGSEEGVTTTQVSPNDNLEQEPPALLS